MSSAATLEIRKLSAHIGAEVLNQNLAEDLNAETVAELNRLWLEHVVLGFRGQELSQEDFSMKRTLF